MEAENRENGCDDRSISLVLVRNSYPRTLVEYLNVRGFGIMSREPGIYTALKSQLFNILILASKELDPENYTWLNSLRDDLQQKEYYRLLEKNCHLDERAEEYGEAVLSVVDEANSGNVEKWKEDEDMASLLYKTRQEGRQAGILEGRQAGNLEARRQMALRMLKANKLSVADIALYSGLSQDEISLLSDSDNSKEMR